MSDFNCDCTPTYPNGAAGPIPPFWGFSAFTPTIPKLYWDVKSQEQRILNIFDLLNKLVCYAEQMGIQLNVSQDELEKLKADFEKFQDSGFEDYYAAQIEQWIRDNFNKIMKQILNQGIFFGLTEDGYFCANVAYQLTFVLDTIANYSDENYGRLTITY